jgi:PAS domain S-box-containing protein
MTSGQSEVVEETVPTPYGDRTFLSSKAPYRNASGEIIGITGISRDITELKRTEETLRESEERYREIVETAEEGIATHEPDGTITYVNQRMADMLGYSREEVIGRSSLDFVDDEEREKVNQARESLKEEGSFSKERKMRRKDGSIAARQRRQLPWLPGDAYRHHRAQAGRGETPGK